MENVLAKLKDNMQVIYRKAVDADAFLNNLHAQGQGKFSEVFAEDVGFNVKSKRFSPYVDDLAKDVMAIEEQSLEEAQKSLPDIIRKMELILSTLAQLRGVTKSK
jgi:peroxiredoxin